MRALRTTTAITGKDVRTALTTLSPGGGSPACEVRDLMLGRTIRFVAKRR